MMNKKNTIIFILGPTSSGKTRVSIELAKKIQGEIISCDSMQVYKNMDIINQSPPKEIAGDIKHHLIRIIPPEEEYSAAKFTEDAKKSIKEIISRGKVPVFAGGTGLYVKSLVDGIFAGPARDNDFRERMNDLARKRGKGYLHGKLEKIDPVTASKLHPNDIRRIIRALEVYDQSGRTINEKKVGSKGIYKDHDCKQFALNLPRDVLYRKIEDTVDNMFSGGLVEEVKQLKELPLSLTAEKALGIKEVSAYLDGKLTLEKAKEELKKNTRRYAKRQLTWFRGDKRIIWVSAGNAVSEILKFL